MSADVELEKKGKGQPRLGLVEQGKVSVGLARQYATQLATVGWSTQDTNAMAANVTELESGISVQAENRASHGDAHRGEQAGIDDAKRYLRLLSHALPRVLRNTQTGIVAADFSVNAKLGRSTPKISGHLTKIRSHVAALDSELAPAFGGQSALARLDLVKSELDAADTKQEVNMSALPADTAKLYATKGKLLEAIEDVNHAGKMAFDGDATMVALWNKDILMRARKARKTPPPALTLASTPAPTPNAEPTRATDSSVKAEPS
jgi:hypothetical protein